MRHNPQRPPPHSHPLFLQPYVVCDSFSPPLPPSLSLSNAFVCNSLHLTARMLEQFMCHNHQCLVFEILSFNLYELLRSTQFQVPHLMAGNSEVSSSPYTLEMEMPFLYRAVRFFFIILFVFFFILQRMGGNKAYAGHTFTYFYTCRVSITLIVFRNPVLGGVASFGSRVAIARAVPTGGHRYYASSTSCRCIPMREYVDPT